MVAAQTTTISSNTRWSMLTSCVSPLQHAVGSAVFSREGPAAAEFKVIALLLLLSNSKILI